MQGIYHQSLTGNQGQLGPFDPSIILLKDNEEDWLQISLN
jgi:hypothetical protein